MLQQESPNSFQRNLSELSGRVVGQQRWRHRVFFFSAAHSCCKFLSLKVVCLRPTASSATLWGTSSSARCWRGLASAAICPNCTLSSRCRVHTWERCTTTAHWSAQVRRRLVPGKGAHCCLHALRFSAASCLLSKNIIRTAQPAVMDVDSWLCVCVRFA